MKFDELSHRVIGCAIEVHRVLGPGLPESNDLFSKILRDLRALRGKELPTMEFTRHHRAGDLIVG